MEDVSKKSNEEKKFVARNLDRLFIHFWGEGDTNLKCIDIHFKIIIYVFSVAGKFVFLEYFFLHSLYRTV